MTLNNTAICLRSDTATNWSTNNPQLSVNEIGIDLTNYEIKIGTGATWSNTQNFIANNTTVKSIQSTANTASSRASQALSASATAQQLANSLDQWKECIDQACFFSSPKIFDETFKIRNSTYTKGAELKKIGTMFYGASIVSNQPRVTDTVTYDGLFAVIGIILKALGGSNEVLNNTLDQIISSYSQWCTTAPASEQYNKIYQARG